MLYSEIQVLHDQELIEVLDAIKVDKYAGDHFRIVGVLQYVDGLSETGESLVDRIQQYTALSRSKCEIFAKYKHVLKHKKQKEYGVVFPLDWSVGLKLCSNDCEKIFDPFVSLNLEIEELDERNVCQRNKINLNLNVEEFSSLLASVQHLDKKLKSV